MRKYRKVLDRPSDEQMRHRFKWWWRDLFWDRPSGKLESKPVPGVPSTATVSTVSQFDAVEEDDPLVKEFFDTTSAFERTAVDVLLRPFEYSAWRYEGLKRLTRKYELGKSWIRLTLRQKQLLRDKWPDPHTGQIVDFARWPKPGETVETGWTGWSVSSWNLNLSTGVLFHRLEALLQHERDAWDLPTPKKRQDLAVVWSSEVSSQDLGNRIIDARPGWTGWLKGAFNLKTTTSHLKEDFSRKIESERLAHEIPSPPPRSNKGRRQRGLSWSVIENFDVAKHYGGLEDSQRSAMAKAKRKLRSCLSR